MIRSLFITLSLAAYQATFASPASSLQFTREYPFTVNPASSIVPAQAVKIELTDKAAAKPTKAIAVSSDANHQTKSASPSSKISTQREQLIALGKTLIGTPYQWGGMTPKGFDCSGFVSYLYQKQHGITLPRSSNDQFNQLKATDTPAAGDLVFFRSKSGRISHVGLYLGNGNMLHSPQSGETVRIESMEKPNWKRRYAGARRILPHEDKAAVMVADNKAAAKTQTATTSHEAKLFQVK